MSSVVVAAVVVLGGLGLLFGFGLALARLRFRVEVDPRQERIAMILPGVNCGACGMPGCSGFAEAVLEGTRDPGACLAGGPEVAQQVADITGKKLELKESQVAVVCCGGRQQGSGDAIPLWGAE